MKKYAIDDNVKITSDFKNVYAGRRLLITGGTHCGKMFTITPDGKIKKYGLFQRMWQRLFQPKIKLKEDPGTAGIPEDVARDLAKMMTFRKRWGLVDYPKNMSKRLREAGVAYWEANDGIEYTFNKHKNI